MKKLEETKQEDSINQIFDELSLHLFNLERVLHSPDIRSNKEKLKELPSDDFFEFGCSGKIWIRVEILNHLGIRKINSFCFI